MYKLKTKVLNYQTSLYFQSCTYFILLHHNIIHKKMINRRIKLDKSYFIFNLILFYKQY